MSPIAVLADIHGNLPALLAVSADLERRGLTTVVNLGDHVSGPLWPGETLDYLRQQAWLQIAGNHDRHLVEQPAGSHGPTDQYAYAQLTPEQRAWLATLPPRAHLTPEILLCHGTPADDTEYLLEIVAAGTTRLAPAALIRERLGSVNAGLVLCGHSHVPRFVSLGADLCIVNPGSVGLPAYADTAPVPHVVELGAPHARYAILEQQADRWQVALVAVAYDWHAAAQQAAAQGRADWAQALATGYLA